MIGRAAGQQARARTGCFAATALRQDPVPTSTIGVVIKATPAGRNFEPCYSVGMTSVKPGSSNIVDKIFKQCRKASVAVVSNVFTKDYKWRRICHASRETFGAPALLKRH